MSETVRLHVNGAAISARAGQSLAAALWLAGIRSLRRSPRTGEARGAFCMIGVCQECLIWIDGRRELACMTRVEPGMIVVTEA